MLPFYYTVVVSTKTEEKDCAEAARESVDVDKKRRQRKKKRKGAIERST